MRVFGSILVSISLIGCVAPEGDESFIIQGNLAPPSGEVCSFMANLAGPFLLRSEVDFFATEYSVAAQFQSRVQAADGKESLRTILIEGANIELNIGEIVLIASDNTVTLVTDTVETIQFSTAFSSALAPNGGLSIGAINVVPGEVMARIRQNSASTNDLSVRGSLEIEATVTPFGDFYGDRIEGTSFTFPISVTNNQRSFLRDCPLPEAFALPMPVNACDSFADTLVLCCRDTATGQAFCPPTFALCGDGVCDITADEDNTSCAVDCP